MRPGARKIFGFLTSIALSLRVVGAWADSLSVTVLKIDGKPLDGAVVLVHASGSQRSAAPVRAVMDQLNLAFVPDLLVVPAGSQVTFPNSDTVSHQIYSFSPAKRFQLPLYRGTAYPPVHFDVPGVVTLGCNIHDTMQAYIVVTDAPFFGRTDAKGVWLLADAPRGHYRIEVWHPRLREGDALMRELDLGDGAGGTIEIRLKHALRPAPLSGHPHSWDQY